MPVNVFPKDEVLAVRLGFLEAQMYVRLPRVLQVLRPNSNSRWLSLQKTQPLEQWFLLLLVEELEELWEAEHTFAPEESQDLQQALRLWEKRLQALLQIEV